MGPVWRRHHDGVAVGFNPVASLRCPRSLTQAMLVLAVLPRGFPLMLGVLLDHRFCILLGAPEFELVVKLGVLFGHVPVDLDAQRLTVVAEHLAELVYLVL